MRKNKIVTRIKRKVPRYSCATRRGFEPLNNPRGRPRSEKDS